MTRLKDAIMLKVVNTIINNIGANWRSLVRELGVTDGEIDLIVADNQGNTYEQAYQGLILIFQQHPDTGWIEIREALITLQHKELVDIIERDVFGSCIQENEEDQQFTSILSVIARLAGEKWEEFVREVGISDNEISTVKQNHPYNINEQCYQALRTAKQKKPDLNWCMLKGILDNNNMYNISKSVEEMFTHLCNKEDNTIMKCEHCLTFSDMGFGLVCHYTDKEIDVMNELIDLPKSVSDKKVLIYRGASGNDQIPLTKWRDEYQCYYERYYENKDLVFLCDEQMLNDDFIGMKKFVEARRPSFVIQNYNIIEHCKFIGYQDILEKFHVEQEDYKSLTLSYESSNSALYFNLFSSAVTSNELVQDIEKCSAFIRLFIILHQSVLRKSGLVLVGVIIIQTEYEALIDQIKNNCDDCSLLIMTRKKFMNFDQNFQSIQTKTNNIKKCLQHNKPNINAVNMKECFSEMFAFTALKSNLLMPNFSFDVEEQINQANILLTPEQISIIFSEDKHVLVEGCYGSGKSIVGRLMLEKLAKERKGDVIYYVNCNGSDDLTNQMNTYATYLNKKYETDIIFTRGYSSFALSNLLEILKQLKQHILYNIHKANNNKVNIIVDEISFDELNVAETFELATILKEHPFKHSVVILIAQSMISEKQFVTKSTKAAILKSCHSILPEHSDLKIKTLTKNARNTNVINTIVGIAYEILENTSNIFSYHSSNSLNVNNVISDYIELPSTNVEQMQEYEHEYEYEHEDEYEYEYEHEDVHSRQFRLSLDIPEYSERENYMKSFALDAFSFVDITKNSPAIDIDEMMQAIDANVIQGEYSHELKSSYRFHKSYLSIHNIIGPKPILIYSSEDEEKNDDFKTVYKLMTALKVIRERNIINTIDQTQVLYFKKTDAVILKKSVFLLNLFLKSKTNLESFILENVIIQHFKFARGMEYKNVVIYIDVNEYHLRHYVIEAITRSTCNLVIIVKGKVNLKSSNIFYRIFHQWVDKDLVEVIGSAPIVKFIPDYKLLDISVTQQLKYNLDEEKVLDAMFRKQIDNIKDHDAINQKEYFDLLEERFARYVEDASTIREFINTNSFRIGDFEWKYIRRLEVNSRGSVNLHFCEESQNSAQMVVQYENTVQFSKQSIYSMDSDELCTLLCHPRVVGYYQTVYDHNKIFICMEFMKGGSIRAKYLSDGCFKETDVGRFCAQIVEGLDFLHRNNIIHTNIKSSNILLDGKNNCKIADLDSLMILREDMNQDIRGTVCWMSPEMILNDYNDKTDIWSLGCTVIEMLTCEPPWYEYGDKLSVVLAIDSNPNNISKYIPPNISSECESFIKTCVQRNVKERPSATELLRHPFIAKYVQ